MADLSRGSVGSGRRFQRPRGRAARLVQRTVVDVREERRPRQAVLGHLENVAGVSFHVAKDTNRAETSSSKQFPAIFHSTRETQ